MAIPQARDSVDGPEHPAPQAFPAIHGRLLVWTPDPHLVEQAPHAPYAPHRELTIGPPHARDSVKAPLHGAPQELPAIHTRLRD